VEDWKRNRNLLKSDRWEEWKRLDTDQRKGVPVPSQQKPYPKDAVLVDLVPPNELTVGRMPLIEAIGRRRSRRQYTEEALTLEELSFLLWATQGADPQATEEMRAWLTSLRALDAAKATAVLRTVPSAGARNPFETYLLINRVGELERGLYRYLPLEHRLVFLRPEGEFAGQVRDTFSNWVLRCAVLFVWTVIPYRTEWRYTMVSHKLIAQEAGHICQNLYLASEAIGAGACAIGAYDQVKVDGLLGVDGEEEFAVYVAPVGKVDLSKSFHGDH
jgi:SagB-type dehydrogenase family enzyme